MARKRPFKIGTTFLFVAVVLFYLSHRTALRAMFEQRQPAHSTPVSAPPPLSVAK